MHGNEHAGVDVVPADPFHISPVGLEFRGLESRNSLAVPEGPAFLHVHARQPFPLPVAAVVVRGGEDHGVVGPELREPVVAPMGSELGRQFGVLFLGAHVG